MKKELFKIIIIILIASIIYIITYVLLNNNKLFLPQIREIEEILIREENRAVTINNKEEIKKIYKILENKKIIKKDIKDTSNQVIKIATISFIIGNNEKNKMTIYKEDNNYYVKEKQNKIIKINEEEYNKLNKYLLAIYKIGEKSNYVITNEQIRLKLNFNKETYEDTTLTIENLTENKYEYGEEYILEAFYNNEWHKINWNEEPFFNLVLRIINPKEIVINKINNNLLKSLERGKYRIVKVFNNEESKSDNIKVYSSTEFEIK